jgi:hypothetical protein
MPRVSLKDYHALGIMISQYVFVPTTYENPSDYWAVIDDPHVVAVTARDLSRAVAACARGEHGTVGCDCSQRGPAPERPMLILVQTS